MQVPLFLFPAVDLKIKQGLIFPDQFDVRHTINVAMMRKIDEGAELSRVNFYNLFVNILIKATNYLKHLLQKKIFLPLVMQANHLHQTTRPFLCLLIAMKTYKLFKNPRIRSYLHQAISLALLLPALWLVTNSIINKHKHLLPSGLLVEHAHPFKSSGNSPLQQHSHSQQEYFFYDQITAIQLLIITALILTLFIGKYHFRKSATFSPLLDPIFKPANRQRPPPVF